MKRIFPPGNSPSATPNGYARARRTRPPGNSAPSLPAASHSCGLRTDGTIACWGRNEDGQADPPAGRFSSVSRRRHRHHRLAAVIRAGCALTAPSPAGATAANGQTDAPSWCVHCRVRRWRLLVRGQSCRHHRMLGRKRSQGSCTAGCAAGTREHGTAQGGSLRGSDGPARISPERENRLFRRQQDGGALETAHDGRGCLVLLRRCDIPGRVLPVG